MDKKQSLLLVEAYFRGEPPFTNREGWDVSTGEDSDSWELFARYFSSRSEGDKQTLAETMVAIALGHETEYEEYLGPASVLITMLCARGYTDPFAFTLKELEAEFEDEQNIQTWQTARDDETLMQGVRFKQTWHYGLQLSNILRFMDSHVADNTRQILAKTAASKKFRAALLRSSTISNRG